MSRIYGSKGDRVVLLKMGRAFPPDPHCDKKKVIYYFRDDGKVLVKTSWHFPGDKSIGVKPKWQCSHPRVVGKLKPGLKPEETVFYQKLVEKGYKEVKEE